MAGVGSVISAAAKEKIAVQLVFWKIRNQAPTNNCKEVERTVALIEMKTCLS